MDWAGTLIVFALGNLLAWRELCIAGGAIALTTIFLGLGVIESPRWLASHRGMDAAEKALRALRPAGARLDGTLAEIAQALAADRQTRKPSESREPLLPNSAGAPQKSAVQIGPVVPVLIELHGAPLHPPTCGFSGFFCDRVKRRWKAGRSEQTLLSKSHFRSHAV
eukprot:COSAG03_NODE_1953_length_3304_cov_1.921997_2_plen_166_part_00